MRRFARTVLFIFPLLGWPAAARSESAPIAVLHCRPDGHMIDLQVKINREPAGFCLDSGASHSVIDPRFARRLKLSISRPDTTTGTEPWVIDLSAVPIAKDVEGLVGYELFEKYVVRSGPITHELRLFDPRISFRDT